MTAAVVGITMEQQQQQASNNNNNTSRGSNNKAAVTPSTALARPPTKHKRRYCRVENCTRIVKSQGLCQRHGAKPCKCRVPGCGKQAQGNFNGMCKAHFRQIPLQEVEGSSSSSALGKTMVCKTIVPNSPGSSSSSLHPATASLHVSQKGQPSSHGEKACTTAAATSTPVTRVQVLHPQKGTALDTSIPASIAWDPQGGSPMPLLALLQVGFETKPAGWHRVEERTARGLLMTITTTNPTESSTIQQQQQQPLLPLEPWEMELLFIEILVLTGHGPVCFRHLAHAWGQPEGFHLSVARTICGSPQDANEVSEEESETMLPRPPQENHHLVAVAHDLRNKDNHKTTQQPEVQRSPLDTLIALLSSTK